MQQLLPIKKAYLLAGITILLSLLSIKLAFLPTFKARQINQRLSTQLQSPVGMAYSPAYLHRKSRNLDTILTLYQVDSLTFRSQVLTSLSALAQKHQVKVIELPSDIDNPYNRTSVYQVQKIGLQGSFAQVTRLYNELQATAKIGRIRSALYSVKEQRTSNGTDRLLRLDLFLEIQL
ncbi:hypothetical protein [Mucilaginibacter sp. PAMB04168]|uniref:hypothetical protein n=1 Tax=Mucilaginibacter sp. PAMB04168 TaxID=3138567 RepID=UPI0031F6E036